MHGSRRPPPRFFGWAGDEYHMTFVTSEYFIFRKHYATLCDTIQDPLTLAVQLYIRGIITKAVRGHTFALGLSTSQKSNALLSAVEEQIRLNPETFHDSSEGRPLNAVTGGRNGK